MLYIDNAFAPRLAAYCKNYKLKAPYLYNFSCPLCGDVSKGRQKVRGYLYRHKEKDGLFYKCWHCGASSSLSNFLKTAFPDLHREYIKAKLDERRKSAAPPQQTVSSAPVWRDSSLDGLRPCDALSNEHPVAKYLLKRKIPRDKWELIYYTVRFKAFTNTLLPGKFNEESLKTDHPRLILPFFTEHGKMHAYVARAFGAEEPKYFTIKLDDRDKLYGLERIDPSKKVYVVEGPIDSLFLPNCVAVVGSSFDSVIVQSLKSVLTIVGDNEPRSKEVMKILLKNIHLGYRVCMLPHSVKEKDINDMIKAGYTAEEIVRLIDENTYQGLAALHHFHSWKQCDVHDVKYRPPKR